MVQELIKQYENECLESHDTNQLAMVLQNAFESYQSQRNYSSGQSQKNRISNHESGIVLSKSSQWLLSDSQDSVSNLLSQRSSEKGSDKPSVSIAKNHNHSPASGQGQLNQFKRYQSYQLNSYSSKNSIPSQQNSKSSTLPKRTICQEPVVLEQDSDEEIKKMNESCSSINNLSVPLLQKHQTSPVLFGSKISTVRCALNDFIVNSNSKYLEEAANVLSKSKNNTTKSNEISLKSKLQYSAVIPTFEIFSDDEYNFEQKASLQMIQESYQTVRTISNHSSEASVHDQFQYTQQQRASNASRKEVGRSLAQQNAQNLSWMYSSYASEKSQSERESEYSNESCDLQISGYGQSIDLTTKLKEMEFNLKHADISEEIGVPPIPPPQQPLFNKQQGKRSLAMEFESVLDESPAKPTKSSFKIEEELDETVIRDENHPVHNFNIKYLQTGIWPKQKTLLRTLLKL